MADKKKKDAVTTRKPMILKSDRETSKELPKDKMEKEKPTIILKTREQSAPKEERSQSPKPHSSEATPQPSKIAQNDHKDKKVVEKPSPALKKFPHAMKLLNENLEFNTQALQYLSDTNCNYLVVGVIGTQGVGKSLIMNLIEQSKQPPDICEKILNSCEVTANDGTAIEDHMENLDLTGTTEANTNKNNDFVFKMQDMDHIERGVHCTKGIDMYVTEERVILLDCQPLGAPALEGPGGAGGGLQPAALLLAACHVLLAVQDWFVDYNVIRYIQAAEMLKPSPPAVAGGAEGGEGAGAPPPPQLLLLHNRCRLDDYTPRALRTVQDFYRKAFKASSLQLTSGMYMYSDVNCNGARGDGALRGLSAADCGAPVNLFLLPDVCADHDNPDMYRGHPPFAELARRLRATVLGARPHPAPALSERAWLQHCARAWDHIRKGSFFVEYDRLLP